MTFTVTAIDAAGQRRTLTRNAPDDAALRAALKAEGLVVLSVAGAKAFTINRLTDSRLKGGKDSIQSVNRESKIGNRHDIPAFLPMSAFDVEMGLRQLASMLRSGVPLLAALETVADQSPARARTAWRRVAARVVEGRAFADALGEQTRRFGEMTVRLAEVGERSGELERTLTRAADQLEARRSLRTAVVNALVYPVIAVTMAVAVSAYLVVGVIPKLADFLRAGGAELPALTQMLMDVSDWTVANGLWVLVGAGAALAAWVAVRLLWARGREWEDVVLLRVPITGRILRLSGTALFARSMQIMTESGVTLIDALSTASRLMANRRLRRRVAAARDGVMGGQSLERALAPAREFLPMLRRMAAVGEVTGALPEAFGETARFHEMLLAVAVKRFGMLIEPVMIVVTGGIVGFVYIAFFMALFAIAGAA